MAVKNPNNRNNTNARTTNGAPVGWNTISTVLRVPNVEEAANFYQRLGFTLEGHIPGIANTWTWARLSFGNSHVSIESRATPTGNDKRDKHERKGPYGLGFGLYVYVPNVDAVWDNIQSLGYASDNGPHDEFWGDRTFSYVDPYGFRWTFATHFKDVPVAKLAVLAASQ